MKSVQRITWVTLPGKDDKQGLINYRKDRFDITTPYPVFQNALKKVRESESYKDIPYLNLPIVVKDGGVYERYLSKNGTLIEVYELSRKRKSKKRNLFESLLSDLKGLDAIIMSALYRGLIWDIALDLDLPFQAKNIYKPRRKIPRVYGKPDRSMTLFE